MSMQQREHEEGWSLIFLPCATQWYHTFYHYHTTIASNKQGPKKPNYVNHIHLESIRHWTLRFISPRIRSYGYLQ